MPVRCANSTGQYPPPEQRERIFIELMTSDRELKWTLGRARERQERVSPRHAREVGQLDGGQRRELGRQQAPLPHCRTRLRERGRTKG